MRFRASGTSRTERKHELMAACRRGFTLVEVLCSTVLLSIGLLAVLAAGQSVRTTQRRAVNLSAARLIAQSKMELLRAASVDQLTTFAGTSTDSALPTGNQVAVTVNRYPDVSETNLYQAAVTVTWPEGASTCRVRYDTLIVRK